MVYVAWASVGEQMPPEVYKHHLSGLPAAMAQKISAYLRWQDAQASLAGGLLLRRVWQWAAENEGGGRIPSLDRICHSPYGRPFVPGAADFNISHSGHYVICALNTQGSIGADIEQTREVELDAFKDQWRAAEWRQICYAKDPQYEFFRLWTQKEAVIKADGKGLHIPLADIVLHGEKAFCGGRTWYLQPLSIAPDYPAHLATDQPIEPGQLIELRGF